MSFAGIWLRTIARRRPLALAGTVAGTALLVALVTLLGAYLSWSSATLVRRAVASVPIDWQVQLAPRAAGSVVEDALARAAQVNAQATVTYATVVGFEASTGASTQATGAGVAVGLPVDYARAFPRELRPLVGAASGVLLAQQTAANLHVRPGDAIVMRRVGALPVRLVIRGVVDMPDADSFFQIVGAAPGAAPHAPPDNVVLLPAATWRALFRDQAGVRPETVRTQLHVRLVHDLPGDPQLAYDRVKAAAGAVEARAAGAALVGDNLGARLLATREDALYARLLFLFLALPGAALAALLTLAVAGAGQDRRMREQALLRLRGASLGRIMTVEGLEAGLAAAVGSALGLGGAALLVQWVAPGLSLVDPLAWPWALAAACAGGLLALFALLGPAWRIARTASAKAAMSASPHVSSPLWARLYVDIALLAVGTLVFWRFASTGYQIVLAPEGVAQISVHPEAFIAPLCFWLGGALFAARLFFLSLQRGRTAFALMLRGLARNLAGLAAASMSRSQNRLAAAAALVALAIAFAVSTAVFNSTYNAQARVDAQLTNGADVTVTGTTSAPAGDSLAQLKALPDVLAAQSLQHRYAYVGNDLQDLFGIDAAHFGDAAPLSNAYFSGGDARATLAKLAATPDGILVAEETVREYQLKMGDRLVLRLQHAADRAYHDVAFAYIGVVREFPTAPKDSFLIANAGYVARQTGLPSAEVVLLRVKGDPASVADRARAVIAGLPGVKVTDLTATQRAIGSGLTAISLRQLSVLELAFAVIFLAAATGLMLALSFAERRRTFAILTALGARSSQVGAFIWSETLFVLLGGAAAGLVLGLTVAHVLVKMLTGVFDPPPDALAMPWPYLTLLAAAALIATAVAAQTAVGVTTKMSASDLREL